MGILGNQQNSFLTDRIFATVDLHDSGMIGFNEFATIMDTLTNGDADEKNTFSFTLLDISNTGRISFDDFKTVINRILGTWGTLTGTYVTADDENLREIFRNIDIDKDAHIDVHDYKQALSNNPFVFQWFDLFNKGSSEGTQRKKEEKKLKAVYDARKIRRKLVDIMTEIETAR